MTGFEEMLRVGDLRNDGLANEVVRILADRPELLPDLFSCLHSPQAVVRGHAADALEKVARIYPEGVGAQLDTLVRQATDDQVPMVRWHLAMVFGHLASIPASLQKTVPALTRLLRDPSPLVRSWAISSLCQAARSRPELSVPTARSISRLTSDPRPAVAKRAELALAALRDPESPLPRSWVKLQSRHAPGSTDKSTR